MAAQSRYPVTRLVQIPSKGNKYYVQVTKPPEVFAITGGNRTERRSTGSEDKRHAERLWRSIEQEIYADWDRLLARDPFLELLEQHWKPDPVHGLGPAEFIEKWDGGRVLACVRVCMAPDGWNMGLANELFRYLDYHEALDFRSQITPASNPYPEAMQNEAAQKVSDLIDKLDGFTAKPKKSETKTSEVIVNRSGCPTILEVLPEYLRDRSWSKVTKKEHAYAGSYIKSCVKIIGDKPLDQIIQRDAKIIMETLAEDGLSNSTIKNYKRHISRLLGWAVINCVNDRVSPAKPYISYNPFLGISASSYGDSKRSWQALGVDQLHKLFELPKPEDHQLLLSILITTGMRLDEAALLDWSQFKIDRNGLRYFDLSLGAIVKNDKFSARTVAIPDCLVLPKKGEGRLFDFPVDADGKSSKFASRAVSQYFRAIRYDENDDRKVCQSLRHNLAGLMANLTDPVPPSEHMDWVTGHGMEGAKTQSERTKTYGQDIDVRLKYDIVNRVKHPWLNSP
jgi:integrase